MVSGSDLQGRLGLTKKARKVCKAVALLERLLG